jgi:integrase
VAAGLATDATEYGNQRWLALPRPAIRWWMPWICVAHDFRHTFATWLEDAGIPARSSMR